MLSDRRQRVLCALIEEYVARAMPVGSRTLAERYHLGVSSATVRNDLSALEGAGFITQPHTSAGRIPTDAGYRAFVDELISSGIADEEDPHSEIVNELRSSARELDALMEQTSAALMRLTDCLSIVVAPSVFSAHVRQFSLISLSNYSALIVIVAEDGQVLNRQISFAEEVLPDELASVQNLLNRVFAGKSPREFRAACDVQALEALRDPLAQYVLDEVLACLQESDIGRVRRLGISSLMKKPEFSSSSSLLPLMRRSRTNLFSMMSSTRVMRASTWSCASARRIPPRTSPACRSSRARTEGAMGRASSPSSGRRAWITRVSSEPSEPLSTCFAIPERPYGLSARISVGNNRLHAVSTG